MDYAILAIILICVILAFRTVGLAFFKSRVDRENGNAIVANSRFVLFSSFLGSAVLLWLGSATSIGVITDAGANVSFWAITVSIVMLCWPKKN